MSFGGAVSAINEERKRWAEARRRRLGSAGTASGGGAQLAALSRAGAGAGADGLDASGLVLEVAGLGAKRITTHHDGIRARASSSAAMESDGESVERADAGGSGGGNGSGGVAAQGDGEALIDGSTLPPVPGHHDPSMHQEIGLGDDPEIASGVSVSMSELAALLDEHEQMLDSI